MSNTAPAVIFRHLLDGSGGSKVLSQPELDAWQSADGPLWVHLDLVNPQTHRWLSQNGDLPKSVQDLLLAQETRPRCISFERGLLVVLRGVNTNPGEDPEDMVAVRIWIDAGRIITSRRRRLLSVIDVDRSLSDNQGPRNSGEVLLRIVERLGDRIGEFVDGLESRLDDEEDEARTSDALEFLPRLSMLRRQIASVRRFLSPQRDALERLARQSTELLGDALTPEFHQEADRITRYLEDLDLARERAIVLHEELLSRIAQEQNSRMYLLSIVAAIFLPLSFVTGLLGMNVGGLPGVDSPLGFAWSALVMVVVAVGLLFIFRSKKWL
jgi:zinc transporter